MKTSVMRLAIIILISALILPSCSSGRTGTDTGKGTDEQVAVNPGTDTPATQDTEEISIQTDGTPSVDDTGTETETGAAEIIEVRPMIPVGLYDCIYEDYYEERYQRVTVLEDDMTRGIDICVLGIFLSFNDIVSGQSCQDIWRNCILDAGQDVSGYRVGIRISFETTGGKSFAMTVMKPDDILQAENWDYVEMYVYDDIINEHAGWYYHLTPDTFDENSLITTVKVTAGERISEVPEIRLTVFLYQREDMDRIYEDSDVISQLDSHTVTIIPSKLR